MTGLHVQARPLPGHESAPDTPCARCPSPILAGAPRFSELVLSPWSDTCTVDEYHPGCWDAEIRQGGTDAR